MNPIAMNAVAHALPFQRRTTNALSVSAAQPFANPPQSSLSIEHSVAFRSSFAGAVWVFSPTATLCERISFKNCPPRLCPLRRFDYSAILRTAARGFIRGLSLRAIGNTTKSPFGVRCRAVDGASAVNGTEKSTNARTSQRI